LANVGFAIAFKQAKQMMIRADKLAVLVLAVATLHCAVGHLDAAEDQPCPASALRSYGSGLDSAAAEQEHGTAKLCALSPLCCRCLIGWYNVFADRRIWW
jgi:hypothetical protein